MRTKLDMFLSIVLVMILSFLLCVPVPVAWATETTESTTKAGLSEDDPIIQGYRDEIAALDEQLADYKKKQEELESEMAAASASAAKIQAQIDAVQAEIDVHNQKISVLDSQIAALDKQITEIETSIKETEAAIVKQEQEIEETQKLLGERLRAMYMSGNVSTIEILLEADSFESLLNRLELVSQITKHDNKIIEELNRKIEELQKMMKELEEKRTVLEDSKTEVEASRAEIVSARAEVNKKKSELNSNLNKLERYLSNLDADNEELQAYQREIEAQQSAYMDKIYALVNGLASTGDGTVEGGMIWPVPYDGTYISSPYGYRTLGGKRSMHYGIDITMAGANQYNKKVIASASGKVLIASGVCSHNYPKSSSCGCNGGYGNYVVIDHGNGLVAYYAHLASVSVYAGQTVGRGDTIGILGCSGYSTGAHLHFEIRVGSGSRANTAKNPLNYVSQP